MPNPIENSELESFEDFDEFDATEVEPPSAKAAAPSFDPSSKLDFYSAIPVEISLEVGSSTVPLSRLMSANSETVIELNKLADEPLDIKVNGQLFGHGEVVMSNNRYSLRVLSILPKIRDKSKE
jgi:flagellar motor switch protein FliN/FliY